MRYLLPTLLSLFAVTLAAETFYLSPAGNDQAPGTRAAPWKTLAKLNAALKPGDTGILLAGEYTGSLAPASGKPGAPVAVRAEKPRTVKICGGWDKVALDLHKKHHIRISGLDFVGHPHRRWAELFDVGWIELADCRFMNASNCWNPLFVNGAHDCRFTDLVVDGCVGNGVKSSIMRQGPAIHDLRNEPCGNLFDNSRCVRNVYCRITARHAGHTPFVLWNNCRDNVVRECVFDSRWARHFEFFNTKRTLIEKCVITGGCHGIRTAGPGSKLLIHDSIFRYNLTAFNAERPLWNGCYQWQNWEYFRMLDSRLYANTFAMNDWAVFHLADLEGRTPLQTGNIFKNNIFSHNNPGGDPLCAEFGSAHDEKTNLFRSNVFFGRKPGDLLFHFTSNKENTWHTLESARKRAPEMLTGNFEFDPRFTDLAKGDFTLKPDSPAVDRGEPLTRTWKEGSGREVQVEDARYFFDGFGIEGEQGDLVRIGDKEARVVFADIEQHTLVLDRPLKWRKGEPVNLAFTGKAPDLGCFERGLSTGPAAKLPGVTPIEAYDCDFEPDHLWSWIPWWYWQRGRSTVCELDTKNPAATGKGSFRIRSKKPASSGWWDKPGLRSYISPVLWRIDEHPLVTFSYRIPKGTPVGICVWPSAAKGRPAWIFLGGTKERAVGDAPDLKLHELVDDGAWHKITVDLRELRKQYPDITMLQSFGFYTHLNAKETDEFWIDDFGIR